MMSNTPNRRGRQAAPENIPDPSGPDALAVTDGQHVAGSISLPQMAGGSASALSLFERDGSYFVFDATHRLIGRFPNRAQAMRAIPTLTKQASAILRLARCDAVTGARKDKRYRRAERAKRTRLRSHRRAGTKRLGKFGAASPVRRIPPDGC